MSLSLDRHGLVGAFKRVVLRKLSLSVAPSVRPSVCLSDCLTGLVVRARIHGYTGYKRTGFVKPGSVKLAMGYLLHSEAAP